MSAFFIHVGNRGMMGNMYCKGYNIEVKDIPRRSRCLKSAPKKNVDYTVGLEQNKVLGMKKNTSPKERKKLRLKGK